MGSELGIPVSPLERQVATVGHPQTAALPPLKRRLWPQPNYRQLVGSGAQPSRVRVLKALYDWLPPGPLVKLPRRDAYFASAVQRFSRASMCWFAEPASPAPLSMTTFRAALERVLHIGWGSSPSDPGYFSARYARSDAGCELHVILGGDAPFSRLPTSRVFDRICFELAGGWPQPRPRYEREKGLFIVPATHLVVQSHGALCTCRWPASPADDRGVLVSVSCVSEANDWLQSLPRYVVVHARHQTRLLSSHDSWEAADAWARAYVADSTSATTPSPVRHPRSLATA